MDLELDVSELIDLEHALRRYPDDVVQAGVSALNLFGDKEVREVIDMISEQTGLPFESARLFVANVRAHLDDPTYVIGVQSALTEEQAERLPRRAFERRGKELFESRQVVEVETAGDDAVCPICSEIAAEGPYTMEEIREFQGKYPHFLNRDFNCRCQLHFPTLRRAVAAGEAGRVTLDADRIVRDLSNHIKREIQAVRLRGGK